MLSERYISLLLRMDQMIRTGSTGPPEDFAHRLDVSTRTIYNYLAILKMLGAPIRYSRSLMTYIYTESGSLVFEFVKY